MKKTLLLAFVLALLMPWAVSAQQSVVTVGDWSGTTSANTTMINAYYKNSYSQTLYSSTDLGGASYIRAIVLDNKSTASVTFDTVQVYLGHTTKSAFSTTSDWVAQADLQLVYAGSSMVIPGTTGELTIVLDNAFYYNGTDNLVVAFAKKQSSYNTNCKIGYTSTTNTVLYRQNDSDASYFNYPGSNTGTQSAYRANIKFITTESPTDNLCLNLAGLRVASVTESSVNLTWQELGGASYEVGYVEASTTTTSDNISTVTVTGTSYTIDGLDDNTAYRIYVRALCGGVTPSEWDSVTASTTPMPNMVPFMADFEDDFDDGQWVLRNFDATHNQWVIGSAAFAGDEEEGRSLYISNDTITRANAYTNTAVRVLAASLLNFEEAGSYDISFDWRCNGTTTAAFMRAVLIPAMDWDTYTAGTAAITGFNATSTPAALIALDGGSKMNLQPTWKHHATAATIPTAGNYYLCFYWYNSTTAAANPPAAVDNIVVQASTCFAPTSCTVDTALTGTNTVTLNINHPEATTFYLIWHRNGSEVYDTVDVSGTSYTFTNLVMGGTYSGWVYTVCGTDTSLVAREFTFTTSCGALTAADLPYTETFESYSSGATNPINACWHKSTNASTAYPYPYSTAAINGNIGLYFYGYDYSTSHYYSWAALPPIDETMNMSDLMVDFLVKRSATVTNTSTYTYKCTLMVGVTTTTDSLTTVEWIDTLDYSSEAASSVHSAEVSFANYNGSGRYVVLYAPTPVHATTYNYNYVYVDDVTLRFIPSCYRPTEAVASDISSDEATISWIPDSRTPNPSWVIEYGPEGFADGDGIQVTTSDTSVTLSGLTSNTVYEVRVSANCGSDISDPRVITFRTHCVDIATSDLPYVETFEAYTSGAANPISTCWFKGTNGTTNYPYPYSTNAIDGNISLYFYGYYPSSATATRIYSYAAMPAFEASVSELGVAFLARRHATATNKSYIVVGVMTDPEDITTFDTVQVVDLTNEEVSSVHSIFVSLDSYQGNGQYIAFYSPVPQLSGSSTTATNYIYLDDITVDLLPGCPRAQSFAVANVTDEDVTVAIEDSNNVNNYIVTLSNLSDTNVDDVTVNVLSSPYTINGLTPNTNYRVTMVSDCGDGTYTTPYWVDFTTQCEAIASDSLPWIESFDNLPSGVAPECWTVLGGNITVRSNASTAYNGSQHLDFRGSLRNIIAFPQFETELNNLILRFQTRPESTSASCGTFSVGYLTNYPDTSSFVALETYAVADFGSTISYQAKEVSLSTVPGGAVLAFRHKPTSTAYYWYVDTVNVSLAPSCARPTDVTVDSVTSGSVALSWIGNANSYEVEYADNSDFTGAQTVTAIGENVTVTGLAPYSTYYFRLRGDCDDLISDWSFPVSAVTLVECGENAVNIVDTIGDGTSTSAYFFYTSSSTYPKGLSAHIFTAQEMAAMGLQTNNVINGIKLHAATTGGTIRKAKIYLVETSLAGIGSTAANDTINRSTATLVYSGDIVSTPSSWIEIPFDTVFNYSGNGNLMLILARDSTASAAASFYYTSSTPDYLNYYAYTNASGSSYCYRTYYRPNVIFNICTEIPSCSRPENVVVTSVTSDTLCLGWTGTAAAYEVMLSTSSVNPDSVSLPAAGVTVYTTTANALTIGGLTDNTTYYYYVRGVCGTDVSAYSFEGSITTSCLPQSIPFYDNFDTYTNLFVSATSSMVGGMVPCWDYLPTAAGGYMTFVNSGNYLYGGTGLSLKFKPSTATSQDMVIMPPFTQPISTLELTFQTRPEGTSANSGSFDVGYITNTADASTFVSMDHYDYSDFNGNYMEKTVTFPSAPDNARIAFRHNSASAAWFWFVDEVDVHVAPSCAKPVAVSVDSATITATSATVHIVDPTDVLHYRLYFDNGTTMDSVDIYDTTYIATLQPSSNYTLTVRTLCPEGDVTSTVSTTFATLCGQLSLPVFFDPNNYTTGTSAPLPNCWTRTNDATVTTNYYPYIYGSAANAHTGTNVLYYYFSTSSGYATVETMAFPEIDTVNYPMEGNQVVFWAKANTNGRPFVVGVMTDPAVATTFQPVDTIYLTTTSSEYTVPFDGYSGNGSYVALRGYRDTNAIVYVYVDDIRIEAIPHCPRAYNPTASNVTGTSAVLAWTDTIGSTTWKVDYLEAGGTVWTEVTATSNPFTLTGLTPLTTYQYRVAPVCADGQVSDYSRETCTFHTSQVPVTLPYSYNFEAAAEWQNWQTLSNNQINWYRGNAVAETGYSMYISADSGATHSWNTAVNTNAVAFRDIDFGTTPAAYQLDFDALIGGATDAFYDGLVVFLVDPNANYVASSSAITTPWGSVNDLDWVGYARHDSVWTHHTMYIEGQTGVKRLVFYHFNNAGSDHPRIDIPSAVDNISITLQACARPFDVTAVRVDPTEALITWDGDPTATYQLAYRRQDMPVSGNIYQVVTGNSALITSLNHMVDYYVFVRKICSMTATDTVVSGWTSAYAFTTPQVPAVIPYVTSFEPEDDLNWELLNGTSDNQWLIGTAAHSGGSYGLYISNNDDGDNAYTLTSPQVAYAYRTFEIPAGEFAVRFDWRGKGESNWDYLRAWIIPESDGASLTAGSFPAGFPSSSQYNYTPDNWIDLGGKLNLQENFQTLRDTILVETAGYYRLLFMWRNDNSLGNQPPAAIDSVAISIVSLAPVCDVPEILEVTPTDYEATVNFSGMSDTYEVAWMQGVWVAPANGTIVNDSTYTLTGLDPLTTYFVGIRAVCDSDFVSDWAVQTFTTEAHPCYTPTGLAASDVTFTTVTLSWTLGEAESQWMVNLTSTVNSIDTTFVVDSNNVTLTALIPNTPYVAKVKAVCNETQMSDWSTPATFTTDYCRSITSAPTASEIASHSVTVSWSAGSNSNGSYQIEYGTHGYAQGNGTRFDVTGTTYTINGLYDETNYDAYVRSVCDEGVFSDWSPVCEFTTLAEDPGVNYYTVTVQANNPAMGTVTGGGIYAEGSEVTLTATANEGYHFVDWNDSETNATRTITVTADVTYTANFEQDDVYYTVTVETNDATMGTVTGGGSYLEGTTATLTATPNDGYHFVMWNDSVASATRTITVTADITYTAYFAEDDTAATYYTVTAVANDPAMGTVTGGGRYAEGTVITLTATPNEGYRFVEWNDHVTTATRNVTVTADKTYTATFEAVDPQGIEEVNGSAIDLYPNPATTQVTLSGIEGQVTVTIVDLNGREVKKVAVDSEHSTLSLDGMAQGAYFVRIVGEQTNAIRKLIVR